jgi:hypothetical protein
MPARAASRGDDALVTQSGRASSRVAGAFAAALLGLAALGTRAAPAGAVVPSALAVRSEVARTNAQAGRSQRLVLDVAVVDEAGATAATGRAVLEPGRPARLDLALADGRRELHERSASGYRVIREGAPVERALPLLPPLDLLQARTEAEVAAALEALGGQPERVDLGMAGGADCWVLGGRDSGPFDQNGRPSYWLDQDARRPVRIDQGDGTRFRFGPPARHLPAVFFPAWYLVEAPGWPRWRVEVRSVAAGTAPAAP